MNVRIDKSWNEQLASQWEMPYFKSLANFVRQRYAQTTVYPPAGKIFAAFDACPFDKVKVVILGQDPYHGPGQANGLCFSVNEGVELPPSLVNIFKEISSDLGKAMPSDGNLERWAKQGVLLLNATLTVDAHQAGSHQGKGWEEFTDAAIMALNGQDRPIVFILWGSPAQQKAKMLNNPKHLILKAPHPSPLSAFRGFFGSRPFGKTNAFLEAHGIEPIDWQID